MADEIKNQSSKGSTSGTVGEHTMESDDDSDGEESTTLDPATRPTDRKPKHSSEGLPAGALQGDLESDDDAEDSGSCDECADCKRCTKKGCKAEECSLTADGKPAPRCYCIAKRNFGIFNMGLGVASGLTAVTLAALVGTETIDVGSLSGDVNGAYLFLICFLIITLATGISGLCFHGRNGNNHGRNLLYVAGTFAVLSITAGVVAGYVQVGTVAVKNLNLGWIMVAGFSALAITAFIWGYCCFRNRRICSTGMKAYC